MKEVLIELRATRTAFMRGEANTEITLLEKTAEILRRAHDRANVFDLDAFNKSASHLIAAKTNIRTMDYLQVFPLARDACMIRNSGIETATKKVAEAVTLRRKAVADAENSLQKKLRSCDEQIHAAEEEYQTALSKAQGIVKHPELPTPPKNHWLSFPGLLFVAFWLCCVRGCTWVFMTANPTSADNLQVIGWIVAIVVMLPIAGGIWEWVQYGMKTTEVRTGVEIESTNVRSNAERRLQETKEMVKGLRKTMTHSGNEQLAILNEAAKRATDASSILEEIRGSSDNNLSARK